MLMSKIVMFPILFLERGKQMIISTNKNPLELRDIYGERIYSRMLMHFDLYEFIGENLRRRVSFS